MRELTYAQAGVEAVAEEMRRDPSIFYMSTDAIMPLLKEFGSKRVKATPIAEGALTGIAIGAAGSGYRPIMDWRQVTFSFVAMDQIVNQAAKIHYMFGGQRTFPILYRANVGGGTRLAAQHCQCPYSMFMNLSGLKMFLPSTPADLKGLLKTAIRDNNPVISFEFEPSARDQRPGARWRLRHPARCRRRQAQGHRRDGGRCRLARARVRWLQPRSSPRRASRSRWSIRAR